MSNQSYHENHHFKATSHYHANRFNLAATEFRNAINNDDGTIRNHHTNEITLRTSISYQDRLIVLTKIALEADEALCKFRSCILNNVDAGNESTQSECLVLLSKARQANEMYTNELEGMLKSLTTSHNVEEELGGQIDNEMKYLISRMRIDLALAFLVTGVSGQWLYLHKIKKDYDIVDFNERKKAGVLLHKAVRLAGCCFIQNNNYMPTWEESLAILNQIENLKVENIILQQERERLSYVLASVRHAFNIVDLANSCIKNNDVKIKRTRKRKRSSFEDHTQGKSPCTSISKKFQSNSLDIRENIARALWHWKRSTYDHDQSDHSSDTFHDEYGQCMKQAILLDSSIMSKRLSSTVKITDILMERKKAKKRIKWDEIIVELESISTENYLVLILLGCIHATMGNAKKGLHYFQKALGLDIKEEFTGMFYRHP